MPNTTSIDRGTIVLVPFPFSDQSGIKLRPAVIASPNYQSDDIIVVGITSVGDSLRPGEFSIRYWRESGLRHPSFIKRALTVISKNLIHGTLGRLQSNEMASLDQSMRLWLGL